MNVCVNVCMRCEHRFLCIYWRFLTNWCPVCAIYFFPDNHLKMSDELSHTAVVYQKLQPTGSLFSFMWVGGCGSLAKWDFIPLSAARHFSFSLTGDSRLCQTILLRKHLQSVYINTNRKLFTLWFRKVTRYKDLSFWNIALLIAVGMHISLCPL